MSEKQESEIVRFRSMEFHTQPPLLGGGDSAIGQYTGADDAYLNGDYANISFRSLLMYGSPNPEAETLDLLKIPKSEPSHAASYRVSDHASPCDYFAEAVPPSLQYHPPVTDFFSPKLPLKRAAVYSPNVHTETTSSKKKGKKRPTLSEKAKCLQDLLPWNEKMDIATVLESAYNYIRFLQAQISALQSMPSETCSASAYGGATVLYGDLGLLNRQQLLQAVVNSQVTQAQLFSQSCCVYSVEQVLHLMKNAETNALYQEMMFGSCYSSDFFLP